LKFSELLQKLTFSESFAKNWSQVVFSRALSTYLLCYCFGCNEITAVKYSFICLFSCAFRSPSDEVSRPCRFLTFAWQCRVSYYGHTTKRLSTWTPTNALWQKLHVPRSIVVFEKITWGTTHQQEPPYVPLLAPLMSIRNVHPKETFFSKCNLAAQTVKQRDVSLRQLYSHKVA